MNQEKSTSFTRIKHMLSEIPFFEDFTKTEMDAFSRYLSLRFFPAHTAIFERGDIGDYLFFVMAGMVEVRIEASDLKQFIIASFGPGSCVGEMSIMDNYPRSATVFVTEPSELLMISRARFETICDDHPKLGLKFLRGVAGNLSMRLRKTNGRFADIA